MERAALRFRHFSRQMEDEKNSSILDSESESRTRKRRGGFDDFNLFFGSWNGSIEEALVEPATRPRRRRFDWTESDSEHPVDKRVRITLPGTGPPKANIYWICL
ncbi:hypothetical protein EON65_57595 [archaeon]|nr:MAG: hypothetical protein EON65_57595 [archaeon]